jgi:hypothetical protein
MRLLLIAMTVIKHIVMFRLRDGITDVEIEAVKQGLLDLPKQIPTIVDYELGTDMLLQSGQDHPLGKNRLISWSACFKTVEDYDAYSKHEAHLSFLKELSKVIEPGSRAAIQYEVPNKK